jgi:hypothetical protein
MIIRDMYLPKTHELSTMTDGDSVLVTVMNVLGEGKPSQQAQVTLSRADIARLAQMYPVTQESRLAAEVAAGRIRTIPDPAAAHPAKKLHLCYCDSAYHPNGC